MKEEITPFLAAVRAKGCDDLIGTHMLFEQIPAYIGFFGFGATTSDELREVAQNSLRELIPVRTLCVCREGKPVPSSDPACGHAFPDHALDKPFISGSNPAHQNRP